MSVWIYCQKTEPNQIYTVLYSPSGNTDLIEHKLLKIKLSISHWCCYRETPISVKRLLAFQSPIFHNLSLSGWETPCLHWHLLYYSKTSSCLNVCKWNGVLKLTVLFVGAAFWLQMPLSPDFYWHRQKALWICSSPVQSFSIREYLDLPKPYSYLKPVWCIFFTFAMKMGLQ